jgi:hypothetical protein
VRKLQLAGGTWAVRSIIVQDRASAAILGEKRIGGGVEQVNEDRRWRACLAVRTPPAAFSSGSVVVQDCVDATILIDQQIAAFVEQV